MGSNNMALIDATLLKRLGEAEDDFRSIMMLARQMRETHVVDVGALKTVEDLLFVARVGLAGAIVEVVDRLTQYRELAQSAFEAVADFEGGAVDAAWPQVISVRADYRPVVANDPVMGVVS